MTGHSILHELTHLDTLAQASGLVAPPEGEEDAGRHGTGDYQSGCQLRGARDWKITWESKKDDYASPDYNAESYAGAATGMCNLSLIGRWKKGRGLLFATTNYAPLYRKLLPETLPRLYLHRKIGEKWFPPRMKTRSTAWLFGSPCSKEEAGIPFLDQVGCLRSNQK